MASTPRPRPDPLLPPLPPYHPELFHLLRQDHPDLAAQWLLLSTQSQSQSQSQSQPDPSSSAAAKKRARKEMVRITNLSIPDHLHYRSLVRRTRLTFEALRAVYQRQDQATARNRSDLRASSQMLSKGLWMHRGVRVVGSIPGVQVGDAFFYRAELCVLGLHTAPQAGIAYIPDSIVGQNDCPIATSIVSSGGYLDDDDSATGNVLVYTGSGGRPRNRVHHSADQTLERGNLALHNSCLYGIEVRVVRGHACDNSPSRKVYVYDGLYRVAKSTIGPGKSGRDVCKFTLLRLDGQDDIGSKTWRDAKELKQVLDARIRPPKYISLDIAKGKELFRVPVYNNLDDDRMPLLYDYICRPDFPGLVKRQRGCHCAEACGSRCSCERKNRGPSPVYTLDGILLRGRPVVYECGDQCGCPLTCPNRLTQRGMKHRLEVFRSKETGWGVRTLDLIQPGAFVCEYAGDVLSLDKPPPPDGSFVFDPTKFPERWREWGDASAVFPDKGPQFSSFTGVRYRLDVSKRRNLAGYICHSRTPNVFLQYVVRGNEDEAYPHLMVFAMETIPPMRDLNIDYGLS
uniref:SET domain-containing protein n=1 Tax=Oryza brachyantha TaxID=4533 RepID=J3MVE9_ORYBR